MSSICFSIVSHGQGDLVRLLLNDLNELDLAGFSDVKIALTLNVPEDESFLLACNRQVSVIRNVRPLGFGSNHNQAFSISTSDYFVVLNPDLRMDNICILKMIQNQKGHWGCCAPEVRSPVGFIEDSARKFPTISRIFKRVIFRQLSLDYKVASRGKLSVDWVAGMLIIFPSIAFSKIGGFDHSYFMYLEDADICQRLGKAGYDVVYDSSESVVHDARRSSFSSLTHLKWHIRSMLRFVCGI